MANKNQDWDDLGRSIQDIVDRAVNARDFQKLNQTVSQAVGKAVDMGSEAVRKAMEAAARPTTPPARPVYREVEATVVEEKKDLPRALCRNRRRDCRRTGEDRRRRSGAAHRVHIAYFPAGQADHGNWSGNRVYRDHGWRRRCRNVADRQRHPQAGMGQPVQDVQKEPLGRAPIARWSGWRGALERT